MHIYGNIAVNPFQNVITLLERTTRNRTCAHRDDVLRLGHLVIETHNLGSHLLCYGAGDNHQVSLPWRRPEYLRAEPRQIVSCHRRRDHFDGTASQAKGHWPHRVLPTPVVEFFEGRCNDALLA